MRKIAVLGSTGSIGKQALNIIRNNDNLCAQLLSCNSRLDAISDQINEFKPKYVVLPQTEEAVKLSEKHVGVTFFFGEKGLWEASEKCEYDLMLNSLLGISGFMPTYNCLDSGRSVALANKETLVAGGSIITDTAKKRNQNIIPVDSEHSAIFQCLQGGDDLKGNIEKIKKVTITASGGAFRGKTRNQLAHVTKDHALKHPNWTMGAKITIDSATLMNKGFEVIEAKWLFDLRPDQIDVLLHPESIIHSMVEFQDNSTLAQLGQPDMAIPISYALSYPERWPTTAKPLDLRETRTLNFSEPDRETFKCLRLAEWVMSMEQSYAVVLNAANEVLVELFLRDRIGFLDIGDTIERVLDSFRPVDLPLPEDVINLDKEARKETLKFLKGEIN